MADYHVFDPAPEGTPESNFVHLHVHSDYSLLDGCSKIDKLVAKAKKLNMKALALTDHGNMFGALNFEKLCHVNGIKPIVGEEFYVAWGSHLEQNKVPFLNREGKQSVYFHLTLLCQNQKGYENMSWLSSIAYTEGFYKKPRIDWELIKKYHEGLICLSGCIQGQVPQLLLAGRTEEAYKTAQEYKDLFGPDHYYIEVQDHGLPLQKELAKLLIKLAHDLDIPLVLTNDIHYADEEDAEAQDALRCIGFQQKLYEPHQTMGGGLTSWYLKSETEMSTLFPQYPEMMANTKKIADMVDLTIRQYKTEELKDCLPRFKLPDEFCTHGANYALDQNDYVRYLVEKGLKKRYKEITPEIRERCEYELGIIFQMGFSGYFLIVWEFINWSKEHGIPIGPGRGSGAGSLVAYAMTITDIDPFRYGLIFERFLNPERVSMPDFDVDMDYDFRQDIIQHTRELYGEPQVGHIVTFGTLKPKNALADVGRVLGIPLAEVNMLKKCIPDNPKAKLKDAFTPPDAEHPDNGQLIPYTDYERYPQYKKLFELAKKLENVNRNTGLHASGMVIGLTALPNWAPVFMDHKTGEVAVQYTMDIIEPCGLVKFDYLGLKTLSLIRYAETIINKHRKPGEPEFHTENVSETDAETFDLFDRGDSVAVFQFESPGMQKILRQAKPRTIEELVALNALYRPGPLDYIPKYIEGKWNPETIQYPDPCLEDLLKETYGVMVYQEQVMKVAQIIAGFSLGGADMLRRAMGKKKPEVLMGKKKEFIEGAVKNGFSEQHAADIFEIMVPFAGYGFNKSHAAAYSVLAYRTGWLKCHKPAEFMAANLTNEITSTDKMPDYIEEARHMGIAVDPPDVNRSDVVFDVIDNRIVFGLKGIKGMGESAATAIVQERNENGPYKSFIDFIKRIVARTDKEGRLPVNKKAVEVLIKTGGFDHTGEKEGLALNRPTLLENLENAWKYASDILADKLLGQGDLFDDFSDSETTYSEFEYRKIEDLPQMELLNMEKECIGCYVSGHPLDSYKKAIQKSVTLTSANIEERAKEVAQAKKDLVASGAKYWQIRDSGKTFIALGMVTGFRKYYTKKENKEMAFFKLADYTGNISCTVFPKNWEAIASKVYEGGIFAFKGKIDADRPEPSFLIDGIEDAQELENRSVQAIHVTLDPGFDNPAALTQLSDFLFDNKGNCSVYFHISINNSPYIIKSNGQLGLSPDPDVIKGLKDVSFVKEVWTE